MRYSPGQRLLPHLTLIDALDASSRDPVYIVWNHEALCPMACKIFASPARARYEAEILAVLAHPNIVRSFGLAGGRGQPRCLLMEYLEGRSMRQALRRAGNKPMGLSNTMRLAIHLCVALRHMHGRGILHLDIKPSNVIIAHGRPVLFDFGVARRGAEWNARHFGGSDPYMPPEQIRGEPVSPASDIFSLAMTVFELLTGELPFPKPTRRRRHPQLANLPRRLRALRPRLPVALDELIMACLAPDPGSRPRRAADLVEPFHRFIGSGPAMWPPMVRRAEYSRAGAIPA